jgi:hypothetical protein
MRTLKVDPEQFVALVSLVKAGQVHEVESDTAPIAEASNFELAGFKGIPPKKKITHAPGYPDYSKSNAAGLRRGAVTGVAGAAIGALIGRLLAKKDQGMIPTVTGAAIGGLAGAIPGYHSGKEDALSDYSRLLFLRRRLGVNDPGELEVFNRNPESLKLLKSRGKIKHEPELAD